MIGEGIGEICRFITESEAITLICHTSPDGDSLGSALGIKLALDDIGKPAEVVCVDRVPGTYLFLPGSDQVKLPADAIGYPAVLTVDCADMLRMGAARQLFENADITANLDHHGTNDMFAGVNWVERRAACGELALEVIKGLGVEVTSSIATCIYTAIMTDTGCFAYANTTQSTMAAAGEMILSGADNAAINRAVYHCSPVERIRLHAYALSRLELHCNGRIAISCVSEEDIQRFGALQEHCDGIVESLRDIDTVEIAIFLKQNGDDIKASLRGKWRANVARMASCMGGGGHEKAAGYTHANATLDCAAAKALELAGKEFELCMKE